jgi:hypothetical protein
VGGLVVKGAEAEISNAWDKHWAGRKERSKRWERTVVRRNRLLNKSKRRLSIWAGNFKNARMNPRLKLNLSESFSINTSYVSWPRPLRIRLSHSSNPNWEFKLVGKRLGHKVPRSGMLQIL